MTAYFQLVPSVGKLCVSWQPVEKKEAKPKRHFRGNSERARIVVFVVNLACPVQESLRGGSQSLSLSLFLPLCPVTTRKSPLAPVSYQGCSK